MATEHQRRARRQEKRGAAHYGGTLNPGSGNGWLHKGDVRTARFSIEFKTTAKRSFSLRLDDLLAIERAALLDGRDPLFVVEIAGKTYAVLAEAVLDELLDGGP